MSARTFENARKIARAAVFAHARAGGRGESIDDSDRAIGITFMSNLLWEVAAADGGFVGLGDAAFEAFCEEHPGTVSRAIAERALWAREIRWPEDTEEESEHARWRGAYKRNLAFREAHPEPLELRPAAAPERIAHAERSQRLKHRDPAAARALAANIDRLLGPKHGEAV